MIKKSFVLIAVYSLIPSLRNQCDNRSMRKSIWRDKFDPAAEYVVRKKLLFGGRNFRIGELFNVTTSDRQLRILYTGRFLDFKPEDQKPVSVEISPIDTQQLESSSIQSQHESEPESGSQSDPEPPTQSTSEASSTPARITLANRGWYNVLDGNGKQINTKKLRKNVAEELLNKVR